MQGIGQYSPLVSRMRKPDPRTSRSKARAGNHHTVRKPLVGDVQAAALGPSSSRDRWERYFELYSFAPVALLWLDRNGVIEEINQEGCVVLGALEATVVGRPLIVFVAAHDRRSFLEHMRQCRNQVGPVETELSIVGRDGRVVPVCVHSKRSTHQARIVCWTVLIDLTDRLRSEEAARHAEGERQRAEKSETVARAKNDAKDRFLAMLSHELRTPLTPALFAAARLVEDDMSEQSRMLGTVIKRNIEMEAHLIQDLLDVTRIGRGRLDLTLEVSNVHDIIKEAMDVSVPHARSKQLELVSDFKATSFHVRGDVTRLRQVFWNLLSNAIKFSDSGHVEIRTMNDTSGSLRAIVSDTGIGMDADVVGRLFTPFERHTVSSSRSGLGLGLAICKGIIDAHNGRIWATSAGVGRGSMFEVELPSVPASREGQPQAVGLNDSEQRRPGRKVRILIVDDDADTVKMLASMLTADGHHLGVAHNLHEAFDLIKEPWDIVISDLGLPDGSGLDVARRFRRVPSKPRLIALSGYGSDGDLKASRDAGFEMHIVKPVDLAQLRRLIDHVAANAIPA
jgi:PAS domain S-box-containing protein